MIEHSTTVTEEPIIFDGYDNVNRPKHYCETSIECIDVMILMFGEDAVYDFCMCNAFKYIWRHKHKNGKEDLAKAKWYLDKAKSMFSMRNAVSELEKLLRKYESCKT